MGHDEGIETAVSAIADLIRQELRDAYKRGREEGRQDALQRIMQAVQPEHVPVDPRIQFAGVTVPPSPFIEPSRTSKRAPWGLVPKLIKEIAAEHAGRVMGTDQVFSLVKEKTEHEIADSSIRGTLVDLAENGAIERLGRSEWRFPSNTQEAPPNESGGASADEIQGEEADMFG